MVPPIETEVRTCISSAFFSLSHAGGYNFSMKSKSCISSTRYFSGNEFHLCRMLDSTSSMASGSSVRLICICPISSSVSWAFS